LVIGALTLLIEGVDLIWETSDETKLHALFHCERRAFVPARIAENGFASEGDTEDILASAGHGCDW
jgi:hypothetical protein